MLNINAINCLMIFIPANTGLNNYTTEKKCGYLGDGLNNEAIDCRGTADYMFTDV